jgi:hypothetical protein
LGISIKTGPGLYHEAIKKASETTFAISEGSLITHECFTIGRVMPKISVS